jgi:4-hydroxy-3-polyprenylbenzoate decarboxylase
LRVALGMGRENTRSLREIGELLAFLRQPEPPKGMRDAWNKLPVFKRCLPWRRRWCAWRPASRTSSRRRRRPRCCRSRPAGRATSAPLITWPLVITRGPHKERQNLGIYRMQLIGSNKPDHALAVAPRRRAGFPRMEAASSG